MKADAEKAETAKRGKASELQVAGELLRRGYDVFIPLVDAGIDLVAKVGERFVSIQVKESKFYPKESVYWQELRKKPFDNWKGDDAYYVFTLEHEAEANYIIIPSLWIEKHTEYFYFDEKNEKWFFYFKSERGKVVETRKSGLDLTQFLNNWEQLEE